MNKKKLPLRDVHGHFVKATQPTRDPSPELDLAPETDLNPLTPVINMSRASSPSPSRIDQLTLDVAALTALVRSTLPPAILTPPPPVGIVPAFIPPLGPNGASPSIRSLFPDVEAATITAIITHEFRANELFKLDSRYRDKEATYAFNGSTNEFESSNRAAKDYKVLNSILFPLHTYFAILTAHISNQRTIPLVFFQYLTHLGKLASEYEWPAVLEYHMIFFNRRRTEMIDGNYSAWAVADTPLMSEYVFSHKKVVLSKSTPKAASSPRVPANSSDPCRNFNAGKCPSAKCPWGRPHTCSACGKADHGLNEHPKTT